MYEIILRNSAKRFLKKLKREERKSIIVKIKKLKENPQLGKRLSGDLFGFWKLRFDKYRIIYKIRDDKLIIYIMDIGHRKKIY
tara:strand:+ start:649 stop:897 length:249 start_codon:yes stop_codon:yes gene_type:complete